MNILIVKMSSLGDVIHCIPDLCALRKGFPDANIDWVIERQHAGILKGHPYVDRLIMIDRERWKINNCNIKDICYDFKVFYNELKARQYDLVIDFQGLFRSGLVVGLSSARRKIGFNKVREMAYIFYNEMVPLSTMDQHAVRRYLEIPKYLGIETGEPEFFLDIPKEAEEEARKLCGEIGLGTHGGKKRLFINPNCRWVSKRWPWEYFRRLIRLLSQQDREIILIGGLGDREDMQHAFGGLGDQVHNIAGLTSLLGLAAMFKKGDCLITNDSGPMHLASAVNLPVVALFGPTNPLRTGPFPPDSTNHHILMSNESCSPCYKKACESMACMRNISIEQVQDAVNEIL